MKNIPLGLFNLALLLFSSAALSIPPSQIAVEISAEAVARVALYYENSPLPGNQFDFFLPVNGISQKFENTSGIFHVVGNVNQVEVGFEEREFILNSADNSENRVKLSGEFLYGGVRYDALKTLRLSVLKNTESATQQNGMKIHFSSELLAGKYRKGRYANTFTLILKPVI